MNKLFIVVPCYNEEEALPVSAPIFRNKLRELCNKNLISAESRILLVDDGSADSTWSIIRSLHESDSTFCGIRLGQNRGHQNALTAGLMEASSRCDMSISIDADLQDDINAMDAMTEKYLQGFHIVCGVRSSRETDSFLKRFTARSYYRLMNMFGAKIIFDHADYRLLDSEALNALSHYHGDDLFLRGLVTRLGLPIATVSYDRSARLAGESKYTLKKMLKLATKGFSCSGVKPQPEPREKDKYIAEELWS